MDATALYQYMDNPFGSDYHRVADQDLKITLANGQTVNVRGTVFANDTKDRNGRMVLNAEAIRQNAPDLYNALVAAGVRISNGYFDINGARDNGNVLVGWQRQDGAFYDHYLSGTGWTLTGGGNASLVILPTYNPPPPGNVPNNVPGNNSGGGSGGGGSGGGNAPLQVVSVAYKGTVTVAKDPQYVFTMWHRKSDGTLPKMTTTVTWSNVRKEFTLSDGTTYSVPVMVEGVQAYHNLHRYENKGWMNVAPAQRTELQLGSDGRAAHVWRYERAGQPDSKVHYLLRLPDGNVLDVNFAVPVNGFVTSILANSSDQSRYPLVFDRSAKDHETFDFTVPADGSSSQGAGSPGNASAPSGSTPPPSQPSAPQSLQKPNQGLNYVPGQLLVSLKAGQTKDMLAHLVPGAQITQSSLSGLCTITLPPGTDIEVVRTMLNQAGYSANYNYIYSTNPVGSSPASRIKTGYSRLIA